MNVRARAAALLEVLGVVLAGQLVTTLLIRLLGIEPTNPLERFTVGVTNAELLQATWQMFQLLLLQYAGFFLLIIPLNWWHRRSGPKAYGLTKAGRSWTALVVAGVATVATASLFAWPASTLLMLDSLYHLGLGDTVPWRQALFDTSWRRWEFWLFLSVVSFGFVAFIEELFYRGYCQRRLAEDWGNGPAIIGVVLLFVCAHQQYLTANLYNISTVLSLLILATAFGVVFAWTRSLVPSTVAHAMINVPMTPHWGLVLLGAMVIGGWLGRRRILAALQPVFSRAGVGSCLLLGAAGAGWSLAAPKSGYLTYVALGMVLAAVVLQAIDRQKKRRRL